MKHICVVIVNWNGKKDTLACLRSLTQIVTFGASLQVIVVDNASTDGSINSISSEFPDVILVQLNENLGFTGGNNAGINKAIELGVDYVWLLNNDTTVDKNVLSFLDAFDDPDVGIVGHKIYFAQGHEFHKDRYSKKELGKVIWYAGGNIDWDNMYASHRGVDEVDKGQFDTQSDTPFVTGCSMVIARKVLDKIGLLDDRLYLYFEDLDYCLRTKRAGYKLIYYPRSIVWHINAGSSGGSGSKIHEYYLTRNRFYVGAKYASIRTKLALVREAIGFVIYGPPIKRQAMRDVLLGRWGKGI